MPMKPLAATLTPMRAADARPACAELVFRTMPHAESVSSILPCAISARSLLLPATMKTVTICYAASAMPKIFHRRGAIANREARQHRPRLSRHKDVRFKASSRSLVSSMAATGNAFLRRRCDIKRKRLRRPASSCAFFTSRCWPAITARSAISGSGWHAF